MGQNYKLPPDPQHAVLKRIYPWDEYNENLVMQWLYTQAQNTGFSGTFDDFKLRYGIYVETLDPMEPENFLENYIGPYHIIPLAGIEQTLQTKNKVLNQNIVIETIPPELIASFKTYSGSYSVTPLALTDQMLRTKDKVMEDNVIIEKIPYAEVSNTAGGTTVIIG